MPQSLGSLQQEILDRLEAPVTPGGDVFDLRATRKAVRSTPHHAPAISRAVHTLVNDGVLEWLRQSGKGQFVPAGGWEGQVRYVRRAPPR